MWIYKKTRDNKARFVLGEEGDKPLVCFGVNSSTAEPNDLDPTLTVVRNRAIDNHYVGWIMLNVYPQRATDPADIHQELNRSLHRKNMTCIREVFETYPNADVWAAWGGIINQRSFLTECLKDIGSLVPDSVRWVRKGKLVDGKHPHHPLYLKKSLPFVPFDMAKYLELV